MDANVPLMELHGVGKRYGESWAVRGVDLTFAPGTCTALLGENGAGKSTLIKMMSGLLEPTEGRIRVQGEERRLKSPREALGAGIAVIPQELAYVPQLTVAENLAIGQWPLRAGLVSHRDIRTRAERLVERYGFEFDVRLRMSELPLAERQLVEIVKVLAADTAVLLLDEPTASLTNVEAERLLTVLDGLKAEGRALVYVSHHLDECFRIAERIAVLRNGGLVLDERTDPAKADSVVSAMLGSDHQVPQKAAAVEQPAGARPLIEVVDWRSSVVPALDGVSFAAARGEVVGVFGLIGSGAETVARALGGDAPKTSGSVRVDGGPERRIFRSTNDARRAGVGYVPAERKKDGLALRRPIRENATLQILPKVTRAGFIRSGHERMVARDLVEAYAVRCAGPEQAVGDLSGGNQQKVLLASRLIAGPRILVLHEPTRGVDIGARDQIQQAIVSFTRSGAAAVVVTSDIDEAVAVADRLVIVRDGRIAAELTGSDLTAEHALAIATNALQPDGDPA